MARYSMRAAAAGGLLALARGLPTPAAATPAWRGPASAQALGLGTMVWGVDAISARNAWAVGETSSGGLIAHWNGTAWSQNHSLSTASGLFAVSADSASDVWAAGDGLIAHWNGSAWSQAATPRGVLSGVAALSPSNVWAVGRHCVSNCSHAPVWHALIMHWNGSVWSAVAEPNPGPADVLSSVSVDSPTDAWAVGYSADNLNAGPQLPLLLHWNGAAWSQVAAPSVPTPAYLAGVVAVSATDAWAVGGYCSDDPFDCANRITPDTGTLALHWNGTAWSRVRIPSTAAHQNGLGSVSAVSATDIWTVGSDDLSRNLAEQWNGTAWKVVPSPAASGSDALASVSARSMRDAWAVGWHYPPNSQVRPLIEHWNGTVWSIKVS